MALNIVYPSNDQRARLYASVRAMSPVVGGSGAGSAGVRVLGRGWRICALSAQGNESSAITATTRGRIGLSRKTFPGLVPRIAYTLGTCVKNRKCKTVVHACDTNRSH